MTESDCAELLKSRKEKAEKNVDESIEWILLDWASAESIPNQKNL